MKEIDSKKRQQSIKNLPSIAIALGPEKCRAILMPFLESLQEEDDEIIISLLQTIPQLINFIGGPAYAHLLLELIFNNINKYKEEEQRETMIESLRKILGCVDIRKNEKILMNAIERIYEQSNDLQQKETVMALITEIYIGISEDSQNTLMQIYYEICKDNKDSVRRSAAKYLKEMIKLIPITPEQELKNIFKNFLTDQSELVRQLMLEALLPLTQLCVSDQGGEYINFLKKIAEDQSWKVKSGLITHFQLIKESLEPQILDDYIIPTIQQYLNENDSDTKNKFLSKITDIFRVVGIQKFKSTFLPSLEKLITDKNIYVKANTGDALLGLAMETHELKELENIFNIFLDQNDKENSYKFISKIKNFKDLQQAMSPKIFKPLVKSISIIMQNKKWRIRMNSLQILTKISNELEVSLELIDDQFFSIIEIGLKDKTYLVRTESSLVLDTICKQIGTDKFIKHIMPRICQIIQNDQNYLIRINMAFIIQKIIKQNNQLNVDILQILIGLGNDKVPNIKIVVIEILQTLDIDQIKRNQQLMDLINLLKKDQDQDINQQAQLLFKKI